jgi:type II secretion system protein G
MTALAQIRQLEAALTFFEMDNGRYPTTEEGLSALVQPPPLLRETWRAGGYLQGGVVPSDPWNRPFHYACPPTRNTAGFDLWSLGSDGAPGGESSDADVANWPGGFPEYHEGHALLSTTILGALAGAVVGLPIYLAGIVGALVGRRTWRSALVGEPLAVLVYLAIVGAAIGSLAVETIA